MRKRMIFSICTLITGGIIYFMSFNHWFYKTNSAISIIRNYLPDLLWALSFYSLGAIFSRHIVKNYIIFTAIYVILIGLLFEFLQLKHIVAGTFDVLDIIVYIIAACISCLLEKKYWRNEV